MKKKHKIIAAISMACLLVASLCITCFADATFTGEHGSTIYIPDVVDEVLFEKAEGFNGGTMTDGTTLKFGAYFTELAFLKNEGRKYIVHNYGSILTDPNFWQYDLPIRDSGTYFFEYEFEINDLDIWDNTVLYQDLSLYAMQSASNRVDVGKITDYLLMSASILGYDFSSNSTESEVTYSIKVSHKFDFDNKELTTTLRDVNGKPYVIKNDITQFDYSAATINIRYQFTSGYASSLSNTIFCKNIKYYKVAYQYSQEVLDAIMSQLQQFENDAYNNGLSVNSGYKEAYNDLCKDHENLQTSYDNVMNDYFDLSDYASGLEDEVDNLQGNITYLEGELETMEGKYNSAKEGLDNSNAVLNFFQGIFDAVQGVLNTFFSLDVFGMNLGSIVAILLGAVIVIVVIKLFI